MSGRKVWKSPGCTEDQSGSRSCNLEDGMETSDRNPGDKRFLIVNSVTGDTVSNVRKIKVDNESCQIQFGPVSQPGTYYFYYLPYQVQTGSGAYWKGYLPDTVTLDKFWKEQACQEKNCVEAEVERLESRTRFDSFYPMEVIATRQRSQIIENKIHQTGMSSRRIERIPSVCGNICRPNGWMSVRG